MPDIEYTIIGGGAVGCAIAYEISRRYKDKSLVLCEMNPRIPGENQSSHNSGVTHAGIYYKPGSLKAKLCVEGNKLLYDFCKSHNVQIKQVGKLIVAVNEEEDMTLDDFLERARQNNVPGIYKIKGDKIKEFEPNVFGVSALVVPTSGIINAPEYVSRLESLIHNNENAYVFSKAKVIAIKPVDNGFEITMDHNREIETFTSKYVINSAGLYSDEVAKMVNPESKYVINPIRGEAACFEMTKPELMMNGMNVYPAPYFFDLETGKRIPKSEESKVKNKKLSVGVHLTPTFDLNGNIGRTITIGPVPTVGITKEDYSNNLKPMEIYFNAIKGFFPNIKLEYLRPFQTGIRAVCGDDFIIERDAKYKDFINLIGIDSPGLTSSLAIAKYVVDNYLGGNK